MFIGAGEQVTGARPGGGGLPGSGGIHSYTGLVEGYLEIDNMDLADVDYTGSIGTLSVNGAVAANAPVNWGTDSAISTVSVNPSNGATFTFNGEVASCYFAAAPVGLPPPPIPPPCFYDCGEPGPELVSGQDPLQAGPAISDGPSFSVPAGVCVNANMPSLSVTYGFPHIVSISQQSANIGSTGSFTVTGTNLEDSEGTSSSSFGTTISSTVTTPGQSSESVSFSVPSTQIPGNYQFTISNIWGASNGVSFTVPYPAATVTGISPSIWTAGQSYKGVQITGTNFGSTPKVSLSDPTITVSAPYNTTGTGISTTYIDLSVPLTTPSEPVIVTLTPGSGGTSFTQVPGGPSLPGSNTAAVIGLQQSACPSGLDANSGFSLIAPTGTAINGSGTMTVSFSGGSFNGYGVTAPYGKFSSPESIASHLAALITQRYYSSGLSAVAYGGYILYKSSATLGVANFTPSDSSFTANSPQSCPPVSMTLRLVPVVSRDEQQSSGTTILHNVWRLVTLNGTIPSGGSYTVFEHLAIQIGNGTVPDGQGGWQSPAPGADVTRNIFDDGIGCRTMNIPIVAPNNCITHPPYWQKFTITAGSDSGLNSGLTQAVMTRIPGQVDRLVMTIHEHGYSAGTMNNDSGPMPNYSPDPYPNDIPYPTY